MGISHTVLALHQSGFNLVPLQPKTKIPLKGIGWKKYQYLKQTEEDLYKLFNNHDGNVGVICGEASGNLVVLDADDDSTFTLLWQKFKDHEVKVVKSPRGGHIYFRSNLPVKSKTIITSIGKIEIRSTGLYVVAEESLHPRGIKYICLDNNILQVFKIGALTVFPEIVLELDEISNEIDDVFRDSGLLKKLRDNFYPSRSQADMALITFLTRKGYHDKEVISNFIIKANYSSKYVELLSNNPKTAANWLDLSLSQALTLEHSEEYKLVKTQMKELRETIASSPFIGRQGIGLYKTLLSHIEVCEDSGKYEYHLSIRLGMEKSGFSHVTFIKHNNALVSQGLINLTKVNSGFESNSYTLNQEAILAAFPPVDTQTFTNQSNSTVTTCETFGYLGLFEFGAFGHSASQIYTAVKNNPGADVAQLVGITGRSVNTCRRVLKTLTSNGLLIRLKNNYTASQMDLKELSIENSFIDKASKRRYTHMRQRVTFRQRNALELENYEQIEN